MIEEFWDEIINNEDEELQLTLEKIKTTIDSTVDPKQFIKHYLREIQQSNQDSVWRDLKIFEYVIIKALQDDILSLEEVTQFLETKNEICYFVLISSAIFMTQKQFNFRIVTVLKSILCRFNLQNLSLWTAHYYELFLVTKQQETPAIKSKQLYAHQIINNFTYENIFKKIEMQFHFFVNNILLVPNYLDLSSIITSWLLQMKYQTDDDKQFVDKMLEINFQLGEKQPILFRKSIALMLESLKYVYKVTDVFKPNKIIFRMIEEIPYQLYQESFLPALFSLSLEGEEWFQLCKSLMVLGLTEKITECLKCVIKLLVQRKLFDTLFKIQEKLVPTITIYLKFPKMREGTWWLIECFTLGPPKNLQFMTKLLKVLEDYIKSTTNKTQVCIFLTAVFIKYSVKPEESLHQIITNHISLFDVTITHHNSFAEQLLKDFDWQGRFAQSLLGDQQEVNLVQLPYKGLINIGNTCYMNSLLQALFMSKQFRIGILGLNISNLTLLALKNKKNDTLEEKNSLNNSNFALIIQLQRLFTLMLKSKRNVINPALFRLTLPEFFRIGFAQHDSSELGKNVFDQIDRSLKKTNSKDFMKNYFEGELINTMVCYDCNQTSQKIELYVDINLILPKDKSCHSEVDLIKFNLQIEEFDIDNPYFCDNCQKLSLKASRQLSIKSTGKYLVLTLNRFFFDRTTLKKAKTSDNIKLEEFIMIPVENIDTKFNLYSILIHKGQTVDYGHYFTFVKDKSKWFLMNDSQVTQIGEFKDIQYNQFDTPYMLFYEKDHQNEIMVEEQELRLKSNYNFSTNLQNLLEQDEIKHLQEQQQQQKSFQFLNTFQIPQNFYFNYKNDDDDDDQNGGNFGMQQNGMGNNNIIF